MKKQDLINELLRSPQNFSSQKVNQLLGLVANVAQDFHTTNEGDLLPFPPNTPRNTNPVASLEEDAYVNREDLLEIVRRVFDMNSLDEFGKSRPMSLS